jgi:uncharacterized membrane protein (UPF0136 family)
MSAHPSNTLAALCVAGGAFGYKKTGSLPSLIGGVTLGAVFALASSRIKAGEDFGYELAGTSMLPPVQPLLCWNDAAVEGEEKQEDQGRGG